MGWNIPNNSWQPKLIKRKTLSAFRYTPAYDAYNRPTTPTKVSFTIENASVQPIKGYEQQTLPEGLRTKVTYRLITTTPVETVDYSDQDLADRVIYEGYTFAILGAKIWSSGVQSHYEAIMVMEEEVEE